MSLINFNFLLNSENISFYPCSVKYEIFNFRILDIFYSYFFIFFILYTAHMSQLPWILEPFKDSNKLFEIQGKINAPD